VPTSVVAKYAPPTCVSGARLLDLPCELFEESSRFDQRIIAEGTVLISVTSIGTRTISSTSRTSLIVAPVVIGTKHSYTAKSKLSEVEKSVFSKSCCNDNWPPLDKIDSIAMLFYITL